MNEDGSSSRTNKNSLSEALMSDTDQDDQSDLYKILISINIDTDDETQGHWRQHLSENQYIGLISQVCQAVMAAVDKDAANSEQVMSIQPNIDDVKGSTDSVYEISVLLTTNEQLQDLNKTYRNRDKTTNILSFESAQTPKIPGLPIQLGDLALAYNVVASEALAQDKTFAQHLTHLLIHGVLHLMGYDHEQNDEANHMESLEIQILKDNFGYPNPYDDQLFNLDT